MSGGPPGKRRLEKARSKLRTAPRDESLIWLKRVGENSEWFAGRWDRIERNWTDWRGRLAPNVCDWRPMEEPELTNYNQGIPPVDRTKVGYSAFFSIHLPFETAGGYYQLLRLCWPTIRFEDGRLIATPGERDTPSLRLKVWDTEAKAERFMEVWSKEAAGPFKWEIVKVRSLRTMYIGHFEIIAKTGPATPQQPAPKQ